MVFTDLPDEIMHVVDSGPFDDESLRTAVELYLKDTDAAETKYGPISEWDVSYVYDMECLFLRGSDHPESLNCDLSKWDVSHVNDMSFMFAGATTFNCDLSITIRMCSKGNKQKKAF